MDLSRFRYEPDPEQPGWMIWELLDKSRFNDFLSPIRLRPEGAFVRCRMIPERRHTNLNDHVHGGVLLAFMDIALFASAHVLGVSNAGGAVTLDCSVQFLSPGRMDAPLDAVVEKLRETGRLVFLRGIIEQGDEKVAAFSGTIRKIPLPQ